MSSTLEKAANIFLIIASGVVVSEYAYRTIHASEVQWKNAVDPGYRIGNPAAFDLDAAPRTMLIFTSHTCEFCRASMPFYRKRSRPPASAAPELWP